MGKPSETTHFACRWRRSAIWGFANGVQSTCLNSLTIAAGGLLAKGRLNRCDMPNRALRAFCDACLSAYILVSAALNDGIRDSSPSRAVAQPMATSTSRALSLASWNAAFRSNRRRCACSSSVLRHTTKNSSPPMRAAMAPAGRTLLMAPATLRTSSSPIRCP